ncbi:MAG: RluA family pseudouridine synthase [Planctomycetota bacterium]|nr:RluA family pseudouridine synthase [Planctomycetota bacterium]
MSKLRLLKKDRDLSKPLEQVELLVRASDLQERREDVELRLDRFLGLHMHWRSRTSIQALIRDGYVYVDVTSPDRPNGTGELVQETRPGRRLRDRTRVLVVVPEELRVDLTMVVDTELVLLHEDEDVLAVDKPPMLPVHPSGRHLADTLIQRVHARYGADKLERESRPRLAHRIDRETSGIVLIGMHPEAHAELRRQFEEHEVGKEYLAIVRGSPTQDSGTVNDPIGSARGSSIGLKMACRPDGDEARTDWKVLERRRGCSLVHCRLFTGRQHQIRVHLESIGHPLVGDKLYGYGEHYFQKYNDGELTPEDLAVLELPRQALHHHRLTFTHPRTGAAMAIESPLARDLAEFLASR